MIRLLFAAAVALLVLSLPLSRTKIGAHLRAAAGVCFVIALLPSLIFGLFFQLVPTTLGHADPSIGARIGAGLSCLGALVLLSFGAYAVLLIRKKLFRPKKDPWETYFARGSGKKRVQRKDDELDLVDL